MCKRLNDFLKGCFHDVKSFFSLLLRILNQKINLFFDAVNAFLDLPYLRTVYSLLYFKLPQPFLRLLDLPCLLRIGLLILDCHCSSLKIEGDNCENRAQYNNDNTLL